MAGIATTPGMIEVPPFAASWALMRREILKIEEHRQALEQLYTRKGMTMAMKPVKHAPAASKLRGKRRQTESAKMKRPMGLEKAKGQKTRS